MAEGQQLNAPAPRDSSDIIVISDDASSESNEGSAAEHDAASNGAIESWESAREAFSNRCPPRLGGEQDFNLEGKCKNVRRSSRMPSAREAEVCIR